MPIDIKTEKYIRIREYQFHMLEIIFENFLCLYDKCCPYISYTLTHLAQGTTTQCNLMSNV